MSWSDFYRACRTEKLTIRLKLSRRIRLNDELVQVVEDMSAALFVYLPAEDAPHY